MWMLMALASGAAATRLFVTSYAGTLTTLDLSKSPTGYDVHSVASTNSCSPSPSWLTLDKPNKLLYCIDENTSQGYPDGHGSVNSYLINDNGTLSQTARVSTSAGPVSGVLYGDETPALALAHYDGGAVSANKRSSTGIGDPITEIFLDDPTTTHAHEVILDPTSQFIVVPDLGASKIRTFSIDRKTSNLTERNSYDLPAGTGPRHGAFYVPTGGSGKTYFYLAAELSNTLRGFQVTYTHDDQLDFQQLFVTNTYGGGDVPAGAAAAELQISPDNRFVVVSNRNATGMASDPIATWEIQDDASLSFVQLQGTGGPFPRQFSINAAGDILAAGLSDGRVVFIARDVESGKLGETLATQEIAGTITCVRFHLRRAALRAVASSSPVVSLQGASHAPISRALSTFIVSRKNPSRLSLSQWQSIRPYATEGEQAQSTNDPNAAVEESAVNEAVTAEGAGTQTVGDALENASGNAGSALEEAVPAPPLGAPATQTGREQQAKRMEGAESETLYIGNLYFGTAEDNIREVFGKFGEVKAATIVRDSRGLSKGFGYLTFATAAQAVEARAAMDGQDLDGRTITAQYAASKRKFGKFGSAPESRVLYIGNMSFEMTDQDLTTLFKKVKNVTDVRVAIDRRTGQPRGFAHADFVRVADAVAAREYLSEQTFYGRKLRVDFSTSSGKRSPQPASDAGDAGSAEVGSAGAETWQARG